MSIIETFQSFCSLEKLRNIAQTVCHRAVAGIDGVKGWKFIDEGLDTQIQHISDSLNQGDYRFSSFREKLIPKGVGQPPRIISIPTIRDAIVLKVLMETLLHAFRIEGATPASFSVINKVIRTLKSQKYGAYVRIDIKNFYPSVNHSILYNVLRKRIRSGKILWLVMQAIKTPTLPIGKKRGDTPLPEKGVPQGLSISNILANIYMLEFDRLWLSREDCSYVRYVDDILIFCPAGQEEAILEEIQENARHLELEIHPRNSGKTEIGRIAPSMSEISYLGYTFRISKIEKLNIGVRKAATKKMRKSIIDILTISRRTPASKRNLKHLEWCLNLRITGCCFEGKWYGWVHYYSQADANVAWALDKFVQDAVGCSRFQVPGNLQIKSFLRSFRRRKLREESEIPNFDKWTVEKKKDLLRDVFSIHEVANTSEEEINRQFRAKVFQHVKQLQQDMNPEGDDNDKRSG